MLSSYMLIITSILNKFAALENLEILDLSLNYHMKGNEYDVKGSH